MFAFVAPAITQAAPVDDQSDVIEVVGSRSDQALKIDRRTYEVRQNPNTEQKDSIQLLRGLPAVTITPNDQIMLLGSSNVTIQVDGRTVTDPDTIAYLRTLHGSDLERVEVITNPSAQYSAAGTGGIINFILRKKRDEGVSGSANAELASYGHARAVSTVKSKHGKWTYELSAGGRAGIGERSRYEKLRSVEGSAGGPPTVDRETGGGPNRGSEAQASAKVSYEINSRTDVSARLLGAVADDTSTNNAGFFGLTHDFQSFVEDQRNRTSATYVIGELNFDHKGKKEGETLTASVSVFGSPEQHERNSAAFSNGGMLSTDKLKHFFYAEGKVDWEHPLGGGQILSLGGTMNSNRMSERYGFESTSAPLGPPVTDQFHAVEDELAAYATFQQPVDSWTVMPGLRVEQNRRHVSSPGDPDVNITRTYLFPTLHAEHRISKTLDLTLSYSKRIDRPQLNDLRPYALVQDVITIKQANPHLEDQSVDAYELDLKYHRRKLDVGLIIYDRETSHLFSKSYSPENGVTLVTIVNSGHSRDRGAEFDISTPIISRVKVTTSVNLFDSRMPVGEGTSLPSGDMFRYTTNGTLEWDGPDRGKKPGDVAQLQWIYNGPWRQFQLHYLAWNQLNLSFTHSFSRSVALTGTLTYNAPNRDRVAAPLVQEYFREHSPAELAVKLLKTFGSNK